VEWAWRVSRSSNRCRRNFLYVLKLRDLDGCSREVGGRFWFSGRGFRKAWSAVAESAKNLEPSADVESHPSKDEGWGTPCS